jgi:hypothetical protein
MLADPHQKEGHVDTWVLAGTRELVKRRVDEMFRDYDALLLEMDENLVPLLGKIEERRTGDVHAWVQEARTQVLFQFQLLICETPAFFVVAHDAASPSVGGLVGR